MANLLYIPEINPVIFYEKERSNLPKYQTKYMDKWQFGERVKPWQQRKDYSQIWMTTDHINLQFESNFDPITVKLIDYRGIAVHTTPALIGLPNFYLPGSYSYEVFINLGALQLVTGCYWVQIDAGFGLGMKTLISDRQYISTEEIKDSILIEYWNSSYHKDVLFETGIKFQARLPAVFGFMDKFKKEEKYRSGSFNNVVLSTKGIKQWQLFIGGRFGLPDDIINMIDEIWTCNNIFVDDKQLNLAEESKIEFFEVEDYPRRGVKVIVEEGINRNSRVYAIGTDTGKRLVTSIMVSAKVFGDTHNQSSSNTIPTINIE
jgi:hypothetical protein